MLPSLARLALGAGLLALSLDVPAAAAPGLAGGEPTAAFIVPARTVREHAPAARIAVRLSAPASHDVSVPFTVGGSAIPSVDFEISPSPLVIAEGETVGAILVTLIDDVIHENTETVELHLGPPQGGTLGAVTSHVLAIQDYVLGDPIEGLTPAQKVAFKRGREVFNRRFTPSEGLGPFYNATSCASCHSKPVPGGAADLYRNFYLAVYYEGTPENQSSLPPFLSQVVPAFGTGADHASATFSLEGARPSIPETYLGMPVLSAQRNSIPVFGTGLFEFISDATILARADPDDDNPRDGISGRINTQINGQSVGRFGTKAQVDSITLFTRGPLQNQMGITSNPLDTQVGPIDLTMLQVPGDPSSPSTDNDGVPDPEISGDDLTELIAFTRFLAPPLKQPFNDEARRGEQLFEQIGCALCHVPTLPSTRGPVDAYTDLLLHDMGEDLADHIQLGVSFYALNEFRTQPLWGISDVGPYLHDGRAGTLREAIELHGGEGLASRDAFVGLPEPEQADVIAFLEHL